MSSTEALYHLGFSRADMSDGTTIALLSGDPERSEHIATERLHGSHELSRNRGLNAYSAQLPSGSGAVRHQRHGSTVAEHRGQRTDSARDRDHHPHRHKRLYSEPRADGVTGHRIECSHQSRGSKRHRPAGVSGGGRPFLTVALAQAADDLDITSHVGTMASTDTFFEGQERQESSANHHLLRRLRGTIEEYRELGVLNFEMEAGTLFKMGGVYGFAAGCVCAIIADRTEAEAPDHERKDLAVANAISVAIAAADGWDGR